MRLLAEHVGACVELDPPGPVVEVDERRLAMPAAGMDSAGDAVGEVGLLTVGEVCVGLVDPRDRDHARELMRERLDAIRPELLEFVAPVVHRRHPNPLRSL